MTDAAAVPPVRVVPANEATWSDLQTVFGTGGAGARCQCQRNKLRPRESFGNTPVGERADRLRAQTGCGDPGAVMTSGLVAYVALEPVGWCAVEPRPAYEGMVRNGNRAAWVGREEDREDESVWAVTCLFTRAGWRRRGISGELAIAAVEFARGCGARMLEAYPMTTTNAIDEELHVGTVGVFAAAGLREVLRPSKRRAVMRIEL
jgi:GNAT superfamily N-acetyltransferase